MEKKIDENKELVITRVFNAPRKLVFEAFTKAEHVAHWWGPKGFTLGVSKLDLRPGGIFLYSMKNAEGYEMWAKLVYHEIIAPEKVVFVNAFSDKEGNIIRPPFSDNWPLEIHYTLTLKESDGKTTLTLRGKALNATAEENKTFSDNFPSMNEGFGNSFNQLAEYLLNR